MLAMKQREPPGSKNMSISSLNTRSLYSLSLAYFGPSSTRWQYEGQTGDRHPGDNTTMEAVRSDRDSYGRGPAHHAASP